MNQKEKTVFVGMSGGVDSSVTAALLQERGFNVVGIHIKMWSDPEIPCTAKEDRYDAMRAAAALNIPFRTWDLTSEYREAVVEYLVREYRSGRTPNPDVMCNREIKFGAFFRRALHEGADLVATGHYARVLNGTGGSYTLAAGIDMNKDQTYFLWTLGQKELERTLFPIGDLMKPAVREMARRFGLPTAEKPDSQGICFMGEIDVREFLQQRIPSTRGKVLTASGNVIGEHEGAAFYTIGQRHGIAIGGGVPYYVTKKDMETNTLTVAEGPYDEQLFSHELAASEPRWTAGVAPTFPLRCLARIRYRQPLQSCAVRKSGDGLMVSFDEPQRAVTPGQSIVFYDGATVLGGAVIDGA